MKTRVLAALIITLVPISGVHGQERKQKPTGACTISVYGITPTCTAPMTQDSCNASAKKVGGSPNWQEGKSCPRK